MCWLIGGRRPVVPLLICVAVALRSNFRASVVQLFWTVAPIILAVVVSLVWTPIFLARYVIGALPALATLTGLGAAHL